LAASRRSLSRATLFHGSRITASAARLRARAEQRDSPLRQLSGGETVSASKNVKAARARFACPFVRAPMFGPTASTLAHQKQGSRRSGTSSPLTRRSPLPSAATQPPATPGLPLPCRVTRRRQTPSPTVGNTESPPACVVRRGCRANQWRPAVSYTRYEMAGARPASKSAATTPNVIPQSRQVSRRGARRAQACPRAASILPSFAHVHSAPRRRVCRSQASSSRGASRQSLT
jgi:hypothetical protein